MTPEQRRELERLINRRVDAAIVYGVSGPDNGKAALSQAGTDLMHYLDEITDYSTAGAEGGCNHQRDDLRCTACADWAVSGS